VGGYGDRRVGRGEASERKLHRRIPELLDGAKRESEGGKGLTGKKTLLCFSPGFRSSTSRIQYLPEGQPSGLEEEKFREE